MSIEITIDRSSTVPLYLQIREGLEQMIERGELAPGTRLPSARVLSGSIGVNRNTVAQAYEAMARDGSVRSSVGQGTFVAERDGTGPGAIPNGSGPSGPPGRSNGREGGPDSDRDPARDPSRRSFEWSTLLASPLDRNTRRVLSTIQAPPAEGEAILFTKAVPDPDLFPLQAIRAIAEEILTRHTSVLYEYGSPGGYGPLRELIMKRLAGQGVDPDRNEILILNGSTQGLDLVARLLVRPSDRVALEVPTYSGALNLFAMHDVSYVTAPVDEDGMNVAHLQQAARNLELKLIYTMPGFHNPCGTSMSRARKEQLLDLSRRHRVPIFEDDPEAELRYEGTEEPPLKAMDEHDGVLTAGTFSKIAFPGFRIGWLAVPKGLFEHVLALKAGTDISTNQFAQVLFHEFLSRGCLEEHLERILPVYKGRRDAMIEALEKHLPEPCRFSRPEGGLVLWVTLPRTVNAESLLRRTARKGVFFTPGRLFVPAEETSGLRLSFAAEKRTNIERGIRILAEEIRQEIMEVERSPFASPDLADGLPLV